eukprot:IDg7694t1
MEISASRSMTVIVQDKLVCGLLSTKCSDKFVCDGGIMDKRPNAETKGFSAKTVTWTNRVQQAVLGQQVRLGVLVVAKDLVASYETQELRLGTDAVGKSRGNSRAPRGGYHTPLLHGTVNPNGDALRGSVPETQMASYLLRAIPARTLNHLLDVTRTSGNLSIEIGTAIQVLRPAQYTGTLF